MKLIDKAAVVAEIKRRKELVSDPILSGNDLMIGERNAYFNLLPFLDTLEVKEVDLKKESLTWKDIPELLSISEQLKTSWWFRDRTKEIGTQVFWEEVLKRFKAQKGE